MPQDYLGIHKHQGSDPDDYMDNSIDHPERMLFFATVSSVLCWAVIGLLSWGLWTLLH